MATVGDIKAWLNNPASGGQVYGRNWSGLCQAFVWQVCNKFGSAPVSYPSAYAAYQNSSIVSTDPNAAPAGAMHYWAIAMPDGHVAISLGGGMCAMGSSKVTDMWATNAGAISVAEYTAKVGGHYLGWAMSNGANKVSIEGGYSGGGSSSANSSNLRQVQGDGVTYWEPTGALAQRIGNALMADGALGADYAQYNDGDPGSRWRTGVQQALVNHGYWNGTPDGLLGPRGLAGVQNLAAEHGGYTGGTDGDPQLYSWTGFAAGLESFHASAPAAPAAPAAPSTPAASSYYWPSESAWPLDGIDVSVHQPNVDYAAFKDAGGDFVIIKWAGANTGTLYLADGKDAHLAGARAAGLHVGFYYVPNNALGAADQAKYFVDSLKGVIKEGDIVALDNEPLDGAAYLPPAEAEKWLDVVAAGLSLTPFFYSNPHIIRGGEDWSKIAAKYPLWVSAYNKNDGTTAGGTIDPKKYWDEIAMWQYTSVGRVPGYGANIDRNVAEANVFSKYGHKTAITPTTPAVAEVPTTPAAPTPIPAPNKPSVTDVIGQDVQAVINSITQPVKDVPVSAEVQAQQEAAIASLPAADLGAIIPTVRGRKVAYAVYALASMVVTNTAIGFAALHAEFPAWLVVSIAVVGNLATPFSAIAIANATSKK